MHTSCKMPIRKGKYLSSELTKIQSRPKRKNLATVSNKEKKRSKTDDLTCDLYCWICHELAQDKICSCQRVYHKKCLTSAFKNKKCPECQIEFVDGSQSTKHFSGLLSCLLESVTKLIISEKCKKNSVCLSWPYKQDKFVKKVDLNTLLEKIKSPSNGKEESYASAAEFFSDVKWIYHNCCIAYGEQSEPAKTAKKIVAGFKDELAAMEACPDCYYHLYAQSSEQFENSSNDVENVSGTMDSAFVRLCKPPHDIVWAQVRGHPYWPAKCLKVVNGIAHLRFFGEFEKSNLSIDKIFHISEVNPQNRNDKVTDNPEVAEGRPSSLRYFFAKKQLLKYIQLYEKEYKCRFPFFQRFTIYKPGNGKEVAEKQNEDISRTYQELPKECYKDQSIVSKDKLCQTDTKVVATEMVTSPPTKGKASKIHINTTQADDNIVEITSDDNISPSVSEDKIDTTLSKKVASAAITFSDNVKRSSKSGNAPVSNLEKDSDIVSISLDFSEDEASEDSNSVPVPFLFPTISSTKTIADNQNKTKDYNQLETMITGDNCLPSIPASTDIRSDISSTQDILGVHGNKSTLPGFLKPKTENTGKIGLNQTDIYNVSPFSAMQRKMQISSTFSDKSMTSSQIAGPATSKNVEANSTKTFPNISQYNLNNAFLNYVLDRSAVVKKELDETMQETPPISELGSSKKSKCNVKSSEHQNASHSVSGDEKSKSNRNSMQDPKSLATKPTEETKERDEDAPFTNLPDTTSGSIPLDPSFLLSCLLGENQRMHSLVQDGKSFLDAFILRILSEANSCSGTPAVLTKMIEEVNKLKMEVKDLTRGKEIFQGLKKQLEKQIYDLQMNLNIERRKNKELEKVVTEIKNNSRIALDSLDRKYTNLLSEKVTTGTHDNQMLQEKDRLIWEYHGRLEKSKLEYELLQIENKNLEAYYKSSLIELEKSLASHLSS